MKITAILKSKKRKMGKETKSIFLQRLKDNFIWFNYEVESIDLEEGA